MNKRFSTRGFTLIEISVILVLAAIILPVIILPFVEGVRDLDKPVIRGNLALMAQGVMEKNVMSKDYYSVAGWESTVVPGFPDYSSSCTVDDGAKFGEVDDDVVAVLNLCECAVEPSASDTRFLSESGVHGTPADVRRGAGCEKCRQTGHFGRTGIHEVLMVDGGLRDELSLGDGEVGAIRSRVDPSMVRDAAEKAAAGVTTVGEAARVVGAVLTGSI